MATRETALRRGTERGRTLVAHLCREAETARLEHGTSYSAIGRAMQIGGGEVARICRGQSPNVSLVRIAQLFAVLGLDLSARGFPVGPRVRDAGQLRLLERLRRELPPDVTWRIEVPVVEVPGAGPGDLRAWDAAIDGPGWSVRVDAETHLGDVQAVIRRTLIKQRDSSAGCVLLLLAESSHHRRLVESFGAELAAQFLISPRRSLAALRAGRAPEGNAILVLQVRGRRSSIGSQQR